MYSLLQIICCILLFSSDRQAGDEGIDSQSNEDFNEVNMLGKNVFHETNADNEDALDYVVHKMSCCNERSKSKCDTNYNTKMSWDRYGELSYFEFIWLLIVELQVDREHGYFTHAHQTGFGEQYEELFRGSEGNLYGTWVGYDVLNDAITRVMLHWDDPSTWAWSCRVFALMFSEPCRFVWYHDKLGEVMTTKCNVRMLGIFYFLKVLPKK
ncbi:HEAT repeat-containing protein [Tanacetum coccineum]